MKKAICALLCLLALALPALAEEDAQAFMIEKTGAAVARMVLCGRDEGFISLYTDMHTAVQEMAAQLSGVPERACVLRVNAEQAVAALRGELPPMDEAVHALLMRGTAGAIISRLNAQAGAEWIAASSILSSVGSGACLGPEGLEDGTVLILTYGTETAAACVFGRGEDAGVITYKAAPISWDEKAQGLLRQILSGGAVSMQEIALGE